MALCVQVSRLFDILPPALAVGSMSIYIVYTQSYPHYPQLDKFIK